MKAKHKISGSFNPKTIYANAGEELKLINDRNGVLIVETKSGVSFPVTKDELTEDENITLDDAPGTASPNTIINKGIGARTKKAIPINQTSLF